jgi:hypothetical protein
LSSVEEGSVNTEKFPAVGATALAQVLVVLLSCSPAEAVPVPEKPQRKTVAAPPLHKGKATATTDLGTWDDVFVLHDQDIIVVRRGDELFSFSVDASAKRKKIALMAKIAQAKATQIMAGAAVDKRMWLFLNSSKAAPCAVDALGGAVVTFDIPGLKVPGSQAPGIQSYRIVSHLRTATLMVAGGDPATWPRDGNRPIYFWMDLNSGKVVRLPIGWDLDYFSSDERVAAFGPNRAIDMKTGEKIESAPNRRKERCSSFTWTDTQSVRPLYERREGKGDADYFAGLSVEGRVLPVNLGLNEVHYVSMVKADDSAAGFLLRREGYLLGAPSPLWLVPFKDSKKTESIANDVTDFAMLGHGNSLYVTVEKPAKRAVAESRRYNEAFFYAHWDRSSWNVLEGVERLPKLGEAFAEADFIRDHLKVRLIEGFGTSKHEPAAICLFEHHRGDLRAFVQPSGGPALRSETWRRAILIGRDGQRSLLPLFQEGNLPDRIWLHNSGRVISGTYVWTESKGERIRQMQLSESTTQKP